MFRKVLLGGSLLCLGLQSTGYAASAAMKEMIEFGVPAARRVLSTVRPLASLFTFQPPVPMAPPSPHIARRYFSKMSDSVADISLDTHKTFSAPLISSAEEEIPLLTIDDPWERIVEVTSRYCVKTVQKINPKLYNPATWLNRLGRDFSALSMGGRSSIKDSRTLREDTVDTAYLWQKATETFSEELADPRLTKNHRTAVHNINIIRLKALKELE